MVFGQSLKPRQRRFLAANGYPGSEAGQESTRESHAKRGGISEPRRIEIVHHGLLIHVFCKYSLKSTMSSQ